MNLDEAKRELDQLKHQASKLNFNIKDPVMRAYVGLERWDAWVEMQKQDLQKVEVAIVSTKAIVKTLEAERRATMDERLRVRRELLESLSDPSLALLHDAHCLIEVACSQGFVMSDDEEIVMDHIGAYLKDKLSQVKHHG